MYSARTPWWPVLDALQTDAVRYSSGYYVLLSLWTTIGDSETRLRALSVVFALAAIPLVYLLAQRLFSNAPGSSRRHSSP